MNRVIARKLANNVVRAPQGWSQLKTLKTASLIGKGATVDTVALARSQPLGSVQSFVFNFAKVTFFSSGIFFWLTPATMFLLWVNVPLVKRLRDEPLSSWMPNKWFPDFKHSGTIWRF
ncbi:MAG: hypothetical protein MHM6MM_000069 [Cercozoa sp. M6MM]